MAMVQSSHCELWFEVLDTAGPWLDAPETILFHHGIGTNSDLWMDWLPELTDRYRVVRFDMRGFGRSGSFAPDEAWSMRQLIDDVMVVVAAANCGYFHFVGESMGGTIGLAAMLAHQDVFRSVTVSNGAHLGSSIENVLGWQKLIDDEGMAAWSRQLMEHRFHEDALTPEKREWFDHIQAGCRPESVLGALSVLTEVEIREELRSADVPVLILHPDGSPFIPVTISADLHALLPRSEMQVFAHAKHGLPLSHDRQCAKVLRSFLYRNSAAR